MRKPSELACRGAMCSHSGNLQETFVKVRVQCVGLDLSCPVPVFCFVLERVKPSAKDWCPFCPWLLPWDVWHQDEGFGPMPASQQDVGPKTGLRDSGVQILFASLFPNSVQLWGCKLLFFRGFPTEMIDQGWLYGLLAKKRAVDLGKCRPRTRG